MSPILDARPLERSIDLATGALTKCVEAGWDEFDHLRRDPHLKALEGLPTFEKLGGKPRATDAESRRQRK